MQDPDMMWIYFAIMTGSLYIIPLITQLPTKEINKSTQNLDLQMIFTDSVNDVVLGNGLLHRNNSPWNDIIDQSELSIQISHVIIFYNNVCGVVHKIHEQVRVKACIKG